MNGCHSRASANDPRLHGTSETPDMSVRKGHHVTTISYRQQAVTITKASR